MKRILASMAVCLLLLCACAPAAPVAEPAPVDLFGEAYNPFFAEAFPEGYTVYGARFDSANPAKGLSERYALYLTAAGEREEIARYIAMLLGITDEAALAGYAEAITRDGFVQIDGTYAGSPAFAQMKQSNAGYEFDQCTEVDGCRMELSVDVIADQADLYKALILENYNRVMLGELAGRLGDDTIRRDMLCIYVNAQKPDKTEVYVGHEVGDAKALEAEFAAKLSPNWYDEQSSSMGLSYGRIEGKYSFDAGSNLVYATLKPNDNTTSASNFVKSDLSLTGLGFRYAQQDGLCIYEDKQTNIQVAISRPDFSASQTDWNMQFLCDANGYLVGVWYLEGEQRFRIQANKSGTEAGYHYDPTTGAFDDGWPDVETVKQVFAAAFGELEGDFHETAMQKFTNTVQERFGMSWQELYALPVW